MSPEAFPVLCKLVENIKINVFLDLEENLFTPFFCIGFFIPGKVVNISANLVVRITYGESV